MTGGINGNGVTFDTGVPHPARRYDYLLGGKDNFEADRTSAEAILKVFPTARVAARQNRQFLKRAVGFLAETGVRQFLDVGTGIPTTPNTHEVAQQVDPGSRVVYVDNDPIVLVHARALLTSSPQGRTAYLDADMREPETILKSDEVADTFDLARPVGLLLVAVLHFVEDDALATRIVRTLADGLPSGSYLVLSHVTGDLIDPETARKATAVAGDATARTRVRIEGFFDGLDLVDPGVTVVSQWRPEPDEDLPSPADVSIFGGVARKP